MWTVTALGPLDLVRAGADALDAQDPPITEAVSWFEEGQGRFRLQAYVTEEAAGAAAQALLAAVCPGLHTRREPVPEADWVAMALDGLPAVTAGRFVVAGAHALARAPRGKVKLWIEASEAFGTGHHGTTRGCLLAFEALLRQGARPRRVLDVGAGSGVLAIAAAKLGAQGVGVEIDPRAAAIARENLRNNQVEKRLQILCGDAARSAREGRGAYDLVFANILLRPLLRMAGPIAGAVAPGGRLILSGILNRQEPLIRLAYQGRGLRLAGRERLTGWSALTFTRSE